MVPGRKIAKGAGLGLALLALALGAFCAGQQVSSALGAGPDSAYAQETAAGRLEVRDRAATVDDQPVGEVLINDEVVLRIRVGACDFSPEERAMVVAKRIRDWTQEEVNPDALVAVENAEGGAALIAGDSIIVTITEQDAAATGASVAELALTWRDNIAVALGGQAIPTEPPPGTEEVTPAEWTPEEPHGDKIVPVISVLEGVKVGAARVNGPQSKVDLVQGVAQLETHFQRILEIDIYVPITTDKPGKTLDRVQGVGVTALGDIRL